MNNFELHHSTALPPAYLDMPTRDHIYAVFENILPNNAVKIFIAWDDEHEVWHVCLWDPATDAGVLYAAEIGSDDDNIDFQLISSHRPGYYRRVLIDLPGY